jgi:hypothetical protein
MKTYGEVEVIAVAVAVAVMSQQVSGLQDGRYTTAWYCGIELFTLYRIESNQGRKYWRDMLHACETRVNAYRTSAGESER